MTSCTCYQILRSGGMGETLPQRRPRGTLYYFQEPYIQTPLTQHQGGNKRLSSNRSTQLLPRCGPSLRLTTDDT